LLVVSGCATATPDREQPRSADARTPSAPRAFAAEAARADVRADDYGRCQVLFVGSKAPRAPEPVTPLCEEDQGVVFFATGYSKPDNHGYWSAYHLDEEQVAEINQGGHSRPKIKFRQNPQLADGAYVQPRHESYTNSGFDR